MKHPIINKILTEWAHRVHDGKPDVKNPVHLVHLRESLEHLKIHEDVVMFLLDELNVLDFLDWAFHHVHDKTTLLIFCL